MGTIFSPIIADIYIDFYVQERRHEVNLTTKIWNYVDDILIVTKKIEVEPNNYVEWLCSI